MGWGGYPLGGGFKGGGGSKGGNALVSIPNDTGAGLGWVQLVG